MRHYTYDGRGGEPEDARSSNGDRNLGSADDRDNSERDKGGAGSEFRRHCVCDVRSDDFKAAAVRLGVR